MSGEGAILEALGRLERKLDALAKPRSRLLSKREAARRLGISRTRTLPDLIADRRLRVVRVGDGVRIPAAEVERLAKEHG